MLAMTELCAGSEGHVEHIPERESWPYLSYGLWMQMA